MGSFCIEGGCTSICITFYYVSGIICVSISSCNYKCCDLENNNVEAQL
jgi:hypothetical protein